MSESYVTNIQTFQFLHAGVTIWFEDDICPPVRNWSQLQAPTCLMAVFLITAVSIDAVGLITTVIIHAVGLITTVSIHATR